MGHNYFFLILWAPCYFSCANFKLPVAHSKEVHPAVLYRLIQYITVLFYDFDYDIDVWRTSRSIDHP